MQRTGDDSAGFSVDHPGTGGILVKAWGFWSVDVAYAFATSVTNACQGRSRGAILVLDMNDLKPMREEGQQSFSQLLAALSKLGIAQVSVMTTNPLTKLQLVRLVAASRSGTRVEWVAGANSSGRST
jgi:hypothetical protein